MSDLLDDDDDSPVVQLKRSQIRVLEERAGKADEFEGRATTAERKLAFAEAGISLADPKAKYFVNGYDGDLTVDAIKEAAIADGFLSAPDAGDEGQDLSALGRMSDAQATARPTATNTEAAYEADMKAATTMGEVHAVMAKYGKQLGSVQGAV